MFALKSSFSNSIIAQFVREQFSNETRINISQFIKWANTSQFITAFLQEILQKPAIDLTSYLSSKIYLNDCPPKIKPIATSQLEQWLISSKNLFESGLPTADSSNPDLDNCELNIGMQWVYGIRSKDVKQFLSYIEYDGECILAYFISKIVVLYSLSSQSQSHYTQHQNQIIALVTQKECIATSDRGDISQIRIWSAKTLQTYHVLRDLHPLGAHLIKFGRNKQVLISAGIGENSAIFLTNLEKQQTFYTKCCDSPTVQVVLLSCFTAKKYQQFIVASIYHLTHFNLNQQIPIVTNLQHGDTSKISCCVFYHINETFSYLSSYDNSFRKVVVTGHEKGEVIVRYLNEPQKVFKLCQKSNQILKLIITQNYLFIVQNSSYLQFWDIRFQNKSALKVLDLTQIVKHLNSYNIYELLVIPSANQASRNTNFQLLIMTEQSQMFILGQQKQNQTQYQLQPTNHNYEITRLENIIPLEQSIISAHFLPNSKIIYATFVNGTVIGIDVEAQTQVQLWKIGEQIVACDACQHKLVGTVIVIATASKKIYTRINLLESFQKLTMEASITSLSICKDTLSLVICTSDKKIHSYMISNKGSLSIIEQPLKLQQNIVCVRFLQKKSILVITAQNQRYIISLKGDYLKPDSQTKKHYDHQTMEMFYSWRKQIKFPVITGRYCKALIAGLPNGTLRLWRSTNQIKISDYIDLNAHSSICADVQLVPNQKYLYSTGQNDHMIVKWRLDFMPQRSRGLWAQRIKPQQIITQYDEYIEREIVYCLFTNNILGQLNDQHLLMRGIRSDTLNKLLKSMTQEWAAINTYPHAKQPPQLSLKLDYVYGLQTFHKTETVFCLKKMKKFIFFVSRVVIVYDPSNNSEQIYQGHRNKVTCTAHLYKQNKQLIASGESAISPKIYIWDPQTLETIRVIKTRHRWGILRITHSSHDSIVSYGLQSRQATIFSLQLINYETGVILAHRNIKNPIYCLTINPLQPNSFVIFSQGIASFWEFRDYNLQRVSACPLGQQVATCCQYYSQNQQDTELLFATKNGNIGVITQQRIMILIRLRAHSKRINCIMCIKKMDKRLILTSSQDQSVRIWSDKFQLLHEIQLKKIQFDETFKNLIDKRGAEITARRNLSVQSISEIMVHTDDISNLQLLVATRSGDVILITTEQKKQQSLRHNNNSNNYFMLKYTLFLKSNNSQQLNNDQGKLLVAHHPRFQIIVTINQNQNILFWDTERNRFIFSCALGYSQQVVPSALKFTKDGDYLMVGFSDGLLVFLDSKITKSVQAKTDQKFVMPSLAPIKRFKSDQGCPILNIQVSDSGQHLAVSYNNRVPTQKERQKGLNTQSYISLFINKNKQRGKAYSKLDTDKFLYEKFTTIACQFAQNTYTTEKGTVYGTAAYSMCFNQCDGRSYLLIFYELIDSNQNRLSFSNDTNLSNFMVWDVNTSTVIANLDLISSLKWNKLCLQSSICCKYQLYQSLTQKWESPEEQAVFNNNLIIPYMTSMIMLNHFLLLGSANGDLHLARTSSLQYNNIAQRLPAPQQMFKAKTYLAHCSQILRIQLNQFKNYCYTVSASDQCVLKWKIQGDLHRNPFFTDRSDSNESDIFGEVPGDEFYFQTIANFRKKNQVIPRYFKPINFLQTMTIQCILGRKSFYSRNNLCFDSRNRIIYVAGHALVALSETTGLKDYLYLSQADRHSLEQIATFDISQDHRFVLVCYNGAKASLLIWQLSSKTLYKKITLNTFCYIMLCKMSFNNRRAIAYALDTKKRPYLLLIDLESADIIAIATYSHRTVSNLKTLDFYPQSQCRFITCGIQEMRIWTLTGNQINYEDMKPVTKDLPQINICMTFVNGILVTGCEDGSITIWKNDPFKRCEHDSMVLVLCSQKKITSSLFFSGSRDGTVIIWSYLQNNLNTIGRLLIQSGDLYLPGKQLKDTLERQIQSLYYKDGQILAGTKSGDIYISQMTKQSNTQATFSRCARFHDHKYPNSFFFTRTEKGVQLFQITNDGLLTRYKMPIGEYLWSHSFNSPTIQMFRNQRTSIIYIAFEDSIKSYRTSLDDFNLVQIRQHCFEMKGITHIQLSKSQKMVAVAILKKSDDSRLIEIFDIVNIEQPFRFLFRIPLTEPLLMMDFSVTNVLLLIQTISAFHVMDLQAKRSQNQALNKTEWASKGLMLSECTIIAIKAFQQAQPQLEISRLLKISEDRLLVFDKFAGITAMTFSGTILGEFRLNMSDVQYVNFSSNCKSLAISSDLDRCIYLISLERLLIDD